jgi:outer membrane protein assembly factor BamE (lipoprotein component of BamABCDE complex)
MRWTVFALAVLGFVTAAHAGRADALAPQALAQIIPGHSTKAELRSLLGAPWRVVQFDDCGQAMAGQSDETWEYRGTGPDGAYRLHVEFDDRGVVHLIAEIPDKSAGKGAIAIAVPAQPAMCLSM